LKPHPPEPISAPPILNNLTKEIAKYGADAIKKSGRKLDGYEKNIVDTRVSHLVNPPVKLDVSEAIKELPGDNHVRYDYLTTILDKVRKKDDILVIVTYIKSAAAENLSAGQRANLLIECLNKLKFIDVLGQFLH
jgi:hypothetical protein